MTIEYDPLLVERAKAIKLLALDVDGVLTNGSLYFDQNGNESKAFNTQDGLGLGLLQRFGLKLAIITGRHSKAVQARAEQLQLDYVYQGKIDKTGAYQDIKAQSGLQDEQICFVGDDWIDLPVLQQVGLAISVPNADPIVLDHVHWVTSRCGGDGAVREVCNLILHAQGFLESLLGGWLDL